MVRSRLLRFSNSKVRLPSQRYICISMRGSRRTAKSLKEYSAIISLSYRVHFPPYCCAVPLDLHLGFIMYTTW